MSTPTAQLTFAQGTLLLHGVHPKAFRHAFPAQEPWVWDERVGAWRCDAIHYDAVREGIKRGIVGVKDNVPGWQRVAWPRVSLPELRPDQRDAMNAWMAGRKGVIVMPTGTGKTEVALAILRETAVSALVVSPVRDLMYQWHRRILNGLGYDSGVIGDNIFSLRPVSVTTYDSACIHVESLGNQFGLIIFDECHHLPGPIRRDAARMCAAPMRLGLTATPERSDGKHVDMSWLIGPTVYEMPLSAARGKTLADYEVVRIPVHLSAEEQARYDQLSATVRRYMFERRKRDPEFSWEDRCADTGHDPEARQALRAFHAKKAIEERAEEKLRVLEDLFRLHAEERAIVFAGSNAMAREVSRRFLIPCLLSHCGRKERLDVLNGLRDGVYAALVA
ncbi:MAG: DEAD/DEAH box helicase, partial [Planctomycetes bacterium]|nr:DEAD/DEAH box helicase [Planctomycetota bacterium]